MCRVGRGYTVIFLSFLSFNFLCLHLIHLKKKKDLLSHSFLYYTSAQEEASIAPTLNEYLLTALLRLLPLHFFLRKIALKQGNSCDVRALGFLPGEATHQQQGLGKLIAQCQPPH